MNEAEKLVKNIFGNLSTPENVEIIHRKEEIPVKLPEAVYVIVDVMYFSTTSVEILDGGAEELLVYRELKQKEETEATLLGGERDPEYDAKDGYDLFNSPSFVEELELEGHRVGLTSTNGAEAVHLVEEAAEGDFETIIGSTVNAEAVARYLEGEERPVHIIACGRSGDRIKEDYLGAYLITRHMQGEVSDELRSQVSEGIDEAVRYYYETVPDVREKDVKNHIQRIDSSDLVPVKTDREPIRFEAKLLGKNS